MTGGVPAAALSGESWSSAYGSHGASPFGRHLAGSDRSFLREAAAALSRTPKSSEFPAQEEEEDFDDGSEPSEDSVDLDPVLDIPERLLVRRPTFFQRLRARFAGDWFPQDVRMAITGAIFSLLILIFAVFLLHSIFRDANISERLRQLFKRSDQPTERVISAAVTEKTNLEVCERQIAAAEDSVHRHFELYRQQTDTFDDLLNELNLRLDGCVAEMVTKDDLKKLSKVTKFDIESLTKTTKYDLDTLGKATKDDIDKLSQLHAEDVDHLSKRHKTDLSKVIHEASQLHDSFKSLAQQIDELRQRIANLEYAVRTFTQAPSHFDVNFWSTNLGAHYDPRHTSPTYPSQISWFRVAYSKLPLISNAFQSPPSRALMPWTEAGDCWCAAVDKKGYASLSIRTPTWVIPSYFRIEHLPAVYGLDNDSAPKTIELWVETEETMNEKKVYPDIGCDVQNRPRRKWMHCVMKEEFDPQASVQTWSLVKAGFDLEYGFRRAIVRVTSNRGGSDATCLYRVVLGGEIRGNRDKAEWSFAS